MTIWNQTLEATVRNATMLLVFKHSHYPVGVNPASANPSIASYLSVVPKPYILNE